MIKIRRRCRCGCGGITNVGRMYIWGHNGCNKRFSVEHKLKISLAREGMKFSEEHKRKIGLASKGRKHSTESKRKNVISKTRKKAF